MLPNRTYNGLTDASFGAEELKNEALMRAGMSVRRNKKSLLQTNADKKLLIGLYKKACIAREETGALGTLTADFHVVERALIAIESTAERRLPAMVHGSHTGLPRVYDVAVCLIGRREGRLDEAALSRFLEAYQSVAPLTMRELGALPDMLRIALVKLLSIECAAAMEDARSAAAAEEAAEQLLKLRERGKRAALLEKLLPSGNAALAERLYTALSERDAQEALNELSVRLKLEDADIDALCIKARQRRAMLCARAQNAIKSLRFIDAVDWSAAFERYSHTDAELRRDAVYCRMDERSRGYYRACVERLAGELGAAETVVARQAVRLAAGKEGKQGEAGWYLFMEGREQLYGALRPDKRFKGRGEGERLAAFVAMEAAMALLLILLAATNGVAPLILSIIPAWSIASLIAVRLMMARAPARVIPRMAKMQLDQAHTTLVAVPALITGEDALNDAVERMETHMLATRLDCCIYAVLGDFGDADRAQKNGERALLQRAEALVAELNKKYGYDRPRFFYLHRRREYAQADGVFMGRERKRGAICDLVRLITEGDGSPFCTVSSKLPEGVKYCITLDADTVLPPDAAAELIGCMEHPLNRPEIEGGVVRTGYGVVSPRMRALPEGAAKSAFARMVSGEMGVDGYFPTAPEFYQDVFGCGLFGGKGIFDVCAFRDTAMRWIADNTVLSHDMLEGCFLHGGYAGDIVLYDNEPASFISWWKRQHRWLRGDWQLLPFLADGVRDANGAIKNNPLSWLSRRKILDNLRRSMIAGNVLYTAIFMPYTGFGWHALLSLVALWDGFAMDIFALPFNMLRAKNADRLGMLRDLTLPAARALMDIITLPYAALRAGDAQKRTLYRMFVSRKRLLEWQTAAQTSGKPKGINGYYGALWANPLFGIIMTAGAIMGKTPLFAAALALLWLCMPLIVWRLDQPPRGEKISAAERETLMGVARGTWEYFNAFVTEAGNYLPPDNFQQSPERKPAQNTSPTNIGMALMAALCARELGFIDPSELNRRAERTAATLERMAKWHGHLYNWYRIDTLEPLPPRYVSTVDSGNLAASLMTVGQALMEGGFKGTSARLFALAREMDFSALYDEKRRLFHIGFDIENCELSRSWYDLLASESRLTSFVAIAMGQIEARHWYSLGRLMAPVCGRTLVSWSGTMFEYLMPAIFMGLTPYTLLWESSLNALRAQRRYSGGTPWGISESGYYAFDRNMYYQYRAFGIQKLSLMSHRENSRVVSPYSTLLALMANGGAAMENIASLTSAGALGLYGMYEALDYTPSHIRPGNGCERVQSYMAHHEGMGICAITNFLCSWALAGYFYRIPEMRAASILASERTPPYSIAVRALHSTSERSAKGKQAQIARPRTVVSPLETPETQLLTNGRYTVFITDSGLGFSKCGDVMLTRWRADHLRGEGGVHILVRAGDAAFDVAEGAQAALYPYKAEFASRRNDVLTKAEVCVSARHNAEIRRLTVTNAGSEKITVGVGAFFDVCLAPQAEDEAHPAFNRLTVDARREGGMLLFNRRAVRHESRQWLYIKLIAPNEPAYMADRIKAQGRGKTLEEAMLQPIIDEADVSRPVEPYAAARTEFSLEAGEGSELWLIMGFAESPARAAEDCEEITGELADSFSLACAHATSALSASKTEYGKAELFERMAARLLLNIPQKKPCAPPREGALGVLWKFGVSGDRPILLFEISRLTELRLLRSLVEFQAHFAQRLCACDLVVIGGYQSEYRNELRFRVEALLNDGVRAGHAHLLHGFELSAAERRAIRCAAMLEIDPDTSLNRQLAPRPESACEERLYAAKITHAPLDVQRPELEFDNGTGGFKAGGEYVITLEAGQKTPMPWCNVLANEGFGSMVSEAGGGHTWRFNSRENKLTPWYDSPVADMQGELLLLTDMDSGECFSPFSGRLQRGRIIVEHGYGYSRFTAGECGLSAELTVFVDAESPVKYSVLRIKNAGDKTRRISALYAVEWVLGAQAHAEAAYTWADKNAVFARSARNEDSGVYAYIALSGAEAEACSDRARILNGGWNADTLAGGHGTGRGMSSLRAQAEIAAGQEIKLVFLLGQDTPSGAAQSAAADVFAALEKVKRQWSARLGGIRVHTPNAALDAVMNGRLMYQTWASRIIGRCGYYQCGGAIGFRDQLQDMLPVMITEPERARAHILLCASRQFKAGDVLHWWHEPCRGVRTHITDDRLFLPYAACEYANVTGDTGIFDESVPYLENAPIPNGQRDLYAEMRASQESESLYMHCVRAVDSIQTGAHGLPLMQGGDWNDGMDLVGENGGESVWLAWFLIEVLCRMESAAKHRGENGDAGRFAARAAELRKSAEESGWDGAWYRRAYYGDGTPLGSHENAECSIDCVSQAWAAICDAEHAGEAVNSLIAMLYDEQEGILKLLTPPFAANGGRSAGYIERYIPGVRENGGQYTHAAAWAVMACCKLKRPEQALKLFDGINPVNHALTQAQVMKYKTEPYAVAGDVYSGKNAGRGGWTWYTGASAWLYKVCLEEMLGVKKRGDTLEITPCVPFEEYTVEYRYKSSLYVLHIINRKEGCAAVRLCDDGKTHVLDLTVGD